MKKLSSVVLTVFLSLTVIVAQEETLFGESGLKLTGASIMPVLGATLFENEQAATRGFFWGLEFNDIILVGFGNERTLESVQLIEGNTGSYKFKHRGFFINFYPKNEKITHPSFGFMLGGGEVRDDLDVEDSIFVCLLYTSPSPRDRQKSRMPSSA